MVQNKVLKNEPLAKHTFYGVGGPADELWKVSTSEGFDEVWAETIALKMPKIILGKGSNLLFSDQGFRGRVFVLEFDDVRWQDNFVTVEAGKNWQDLVEETNKAGYGDLCNLSGIPGNFGGFIRGNAGAFGLETGDFVRDVAFLDDNGQLQRLEADQCDFEYRGSVFKGNPNLCILRATLKLEQPEDPDAALEKTKTLLADRWKKYPPGRSGGSFFKNPEGHFAGKLLEEAGAKGDTIGHAQISERHANFIVNLQAKATQADILALARKWKKIVYDATGIELVPEIMIVDQQGQKIEL